MRNKITIIITKKVVINQIKQQGYSIIHQKKMKKKYQLIIIKDQNLIELDIKNIKN